MTRRKVLVSLLQLLTQKIVQGSSQSADNFGKVQFLYSCSKELKEFFFPFHPTTFVSFHSSL
jgi:hypothetical protein